MYLFNDVVKLIYRYMLPKDGNYIITIFNVWQLYMFVGIIIDWLRQVWATSVTKTYLED